MSALLQTQEDSSATASDAIDEADTNGDGTVSLAELAASLGADESELTQAFARVDANSDGQIDAGELEAGLESASRRRGPHGPPPPANDVAASALASADTDGGASLSLGEISTALGEDDPASLSDAFAALDTNGDGGLGADELATAVKAIFARQMAAYADNTGRASTWSRSLAA